MRQPRCVSMTTPISSLSHALQLMRAELTQARRRQAQPGAQPAPSSAGEAVKRPSTQLDALRARLRAARVQPGGLTPPKALRLFVEAALADEWGSGVQLDAGFHELVEHTCQALEADEQQAQLLVAAMQELDALG